MIFEILNKNSKDILNEDFTYQIKFYRNVYDEYCKTSLLFF